MFELDFAYAYGKPKATANFRVELDDFIVDEDVGFEPEGQGEHIYLQVQKRGVNTEWLAKQVARFAEVKTMDVSYCGMKDRHAKTTQWFSIYKPKGQCKSWELFADATGDDVVVLQQSRGTKKLRRGQHRANNFVIRLRGLNQSSDVLEQKLKLLQQHGVPNYFGEQRFGHNRQNLAAAANWLADTRSQNPGPNRAIWMSAMRSYVFNCVLHHRLATHRVEELSGLTGPMWGRGRLTGPDADWELACLSGLASVLNGLEHCGMNQERRPLWIHLPGLSWQFIDETDVLLSFSLGPGQYATSVLRELAEVTDKSIKAHITADLI